MKAPQIVSLNYNLSIAQLFSETTLAMFSESASIDQLSRAIGAEGSNSFKLASWACDWSNNRRNWIEMIDRFLYNAAKGKQYQTCSRKRWALTIAVFEIGLVSKTGNITKTEKLLDDEGEIPDDAVLLERWRKLSGARHPREMNAMLRTIFLDSMGTSDGLNRRVLSDNMDILQRWWHFVMLEKRQPTIDDGAALYNLNDHFHDIAMIYISLVTHRGSFGMARPSIRPGDRIFIAKGSRLPIVLRPIYRSAIRNWSARKLWSGYLFVSTCYLHGFMDGEAVTSDAKRETVDVY